MRRPEKHTSIHQFLKTVGAANEEENTFRKFALVATAALLFETSVLHNPVAIIQAGVA
jgi:hypothetical protein